MNFIRIVIKELKNVKENLPFNTATILSPLLFLFAFSVMVSGGITLPVETNPSPSSSPFLQSAAGFFAPDGTPYLELESGEDAEGSASRNVDEYLVKSEPQLIDKSLEGQVIHVVADVNSNMTKNYANRLAGAAVNFISENGPGAAVTVNEHTWYDQDIPWNMSFAVNTLIFGAMLAGLLFGQLSMTSEWENATTKILALAPRSSFTIVTGKIAAAFIKTMLAGVIFGGFVTILFPATIPNPWQLIAALALTYLIFTCLGLMIGIGVHSAMTAFLISLVISLCLWVAGGGLGDLSYFGPAAQILGAANPTTYTLRAVRYAYFGGSLDAINLIALLVGTVVIWVVTILVYSRWNHSEKVAA